ncbi:MAG: hypothetical protein H6983_20365 [Ectothiorhodospiraceae bacterium]|nr:hypothetical protein [Chromatiales bacterium]MCP5156541.1 hypothetical protein [Ectothiorhodospiraceae bacterium]
MTLERLTVADFEPCVGLRFAVLHEGARDLSLVLVEARATSTAHGRDAGDAPGRTPFALLFRGPSSPVLAQGIRRLRAPPPLGMLDLFLVPVGPSDGAMRYEAVFA